MSDYVAAYGYDAIAEFVATVDTHNEDGSPIGTQRVRVWAETKDGAKRAARQAVTAPIVIVRTVRKLPTR